MYAVTFFYSKKGVLSRWGWVAKELYNQKKTHKKKIVILKQTRTRKTNDLGNIGKKNGFRACNLLKISLSEIQACFFFFFFGTEPLRIGGC